MVAGIVAGKLSPAKQWIAALNGKALPGSVYARIAAR